MLKKRGINLNPAQRFPTEKPESTAETVQEFRASSKPLTKDIQVLSALLNYKAKNFENIQKHTGLDNKQLNSVLEDLENRGLLRVEQKQGLFGTKVELFATKKGRQEYYS